MSKLATVVLFTPQIDRMKTFYGDQLGFPVRNDTPDWTEYDTEGATLALQRMPDPERRGVEFRLLVPDVEERMRELGQRGVRFAGNAQKIPGGQMAGLWDPEGTSVGLVSFENGSAPAGRGPRLATAIVNCRDLAGTKAFYRNVMGLHPTNDTAWWVEFDTGDTHLSLHPRMAAPGRDHHHGRPLTWSIELEDLIGWCDACRNRGVSFPTGPHDTPYGQMADVEDPDGNLFIVHEPMPEDERAEEIEDETPHAAPIRKPGTTKSRAVSRLVVKPEYHEPKSGARRRPSGTTRTVVKVRGAGPDHHRLEPKKTADEKKAKVKPAIGRLKKKVVERKIEQKRATATASRGKVAKTKAGKPVRKAAVKGRRS